jgi:hypothetical protein
MTVTGEGSRLGFLSRKRRMPSRCMYSQNPMNSTNTTTGPMMVLHSRGGLMPGVHRSRRAPAARAHRATALRRSVMARTCSVSGLMRGPRAGRARSPRQACELRVEAQVGHPRVGERDGVVGHDAAWPGAHHQHPRGEEHCLADGVRDEQTGEALASEERDDLVVQPLARDLVDGAEWLVEQEHLRVEDEAARQRCPHLHAAGQLLGVLALEPGEPDQ